MSDLPHWPAIVILLAVSGIWIGRFFRPAALGLASIALFAGLLVAAVMGGCGLERGVMLVAGGIASLQGGYIVGAMLAHR